MRELLAFLWRKTQLHQTEDWVLTFQASAVTAHVNQSMFAVTPVGLPDTLKAPVRVPMAVLGGVLGTMCKMQL